MVDFDPISYLFVVVNSPFIAVYAYRVFTPRYRLRTFLLCTVALAMLITATEFFAQPLRAAQPNILGALVLPFEAILYILLWGRLTSDSFWRRLLFYCIFVAIVAVGNAIGMLVNSLVHEIDPTIGGFLGQYSDVLFIDLFQILLLLVVSDLIARKVKRVAVDVRWSMFAVLLLSQAVAQMLLAILLTRNHDSLLSVALNCITALLCIVADIYIFRTFRSMVINAELEQRVALLDQQQALEKAQYFAVGDQMTRMRRLWHDYTNTLTSIGALLDMGEADKIRTLLSQTTRELEKARIVRTGCPIVDAVLCSKTLDAEAKGIRLECSLLWPASFQPEDIDLMRVFANLLDNAIRYCEALPEGTDRRIDVTSTLRGRMFVVCFSNTFLGGASPDIRLAMSKAAESEHGHGLPIVQSIMEKYGGTLVSEVSDGTLTFRALFSLPA